MFYDLTLIRPPSAEGGDRHRRDGARPAAGEVRAGERRGGRRRRRRGDGGQSRGLESSPRRKAGVRERGERVDLKKTKQKKHQRKTCGATCPQSLSPTNNFHSANINWS